MSDAKTIRCGRPVNFVDCIGVDRGLPVDKGPVRQPVTTRKFLWKSLMWGGRGPENSGVLDADCSVAGQSAQRKTAAPENSGLGEPVCAEFPFIQISGRPDCDCKTV